MIKFTMYPSLTNNKKFKRLSLIYKIKSARGFILIIFIMIIIFLKNKNLM